MDTFQCCPSEEERFYLKRKHMIQSSKVRTIQTHSVFESLFTLPPCFHKGTTKCLITETLIFKHWMKHKSVLFFLPLETFRYTCHLVSFMFPKLAKRKQALSISKCQVQKQLNFNICIWDQPQIYNYIQIHRIRIHYFH